MASLGSVSSWSKEVHFRRLLDWLVYLTVRVLICLIQASRLSTCRQASFGLAWFVNDVLRIRGRLVDENLSHAYPELSRGQRRRMARDMWRHLFLMVCEIAHARRKIHDTNWRRYIRVHQQQEMVRHLISMHPTILVSGHFGNFEMAGFMAGLLGVPTFAIARPLDNAYLHDFIQSFRESTGQFVLPKRGSAEQVQRLLETGGSLALLADQHAGRKGVKVDFFGRPASCHKALALFTLINGAPMLVCYARRNGPPLHFEVGLAGVADPACLDESLSGVPSLTQWYSAALEDVIRQAPEQYWWLHRRWRETSPRRKRAA